ncbi:MAG: hypothetical protein KBB94_09480 [Legionellaceae bacterium]|nr:hypothetical protein [Legionellaceae bacterium]MBP9775942.1 hypothetical protein [Legionellaceae bacterium]
MDKKIKASLLAGTCVIAMAMSMNVKAASQARLVERDKMNTTVDEFKHELRSCRTHIEKKMQENPIDMQAIQTLRLKCRMKLERQLGTMLIELSDIGTALDKELAERNNAPVTPKHTGK